MDRIEFIKKRIKGKVLDVGYYACTLHEEVKKAAGEENTFGIDTEGEEKLPHYVKGSAEKMPFEKESFDTLIAGELIEHLKKPENFIKEANRVLKKNGLMIITTPNKESLTNKIFHNNEAPLHFSLFNIKELKELVEKNNFDVEEIKTTCYNSESNEGSSKQWSIPIRQFVSIFLPKNLKEEMLLSARKK